jgi:polysaccharide export outer membrane protein
MTTAIKNRLRILVILFLILAITPNFAYPAEYKVDSGDVILITVYEQPDLTTKARVNSKGEITFPFLGNVYIKGLTVDEVEAKIRDLLEKDYLVDPQLTVFIENYRTEKVFVMGFVNKPGEYELFKDRPTTMLEAITMAGGFKEGAAQNGTKVIRVENGEEVTIPIKVTDITNRGDKAKDIPVKPGDIIVVPESFF